MQWKVFPYVFFAYLGVLIYLPAFEVPFSLDDYSVIVHNPVIRNLGDPAGIFLFDPTRFIAHLTFSWNYSLHGFRTFGYHLFNILLHVVNSVLCYRLMQETICLPGFKDGLPRHHRYMPFFVALIFLAHPLQTQAVTYIVQRSVLLAVFCYFSSLLLYLQCRKSFLPRSYILNWMVVAIGIMAKPIFVSIVLMVVMYEIFGFGWSWEGIKKRFYLFGPYFLVLLVPVFLVVHTLNYFGESFDLSKLSYASRVSGDISRWIYFLTQLRVVFVYLFLLCFPVRQNVDYDFPLSQGLGDGMTLLALPGVIFLIWAAVRLFRNGRLFSFGLCWFFVVLSVESTIFPLPDVIFEHRLYMAVAGFGIFLTGLLSQWIKNKNVYFVICLSIVLFYGVLTYARNLIWKDNIGLVKDILKKSPGKTRIYYHLGWLYQNEGLFNLAQRAYQNSINFSRGEYEGYLALADLYILKGQHEEALAQLRNLLRLTPGNPEAHLKLADLYRRNGQYQWADSEYRKVLALKPDLSLIYKELGDMYVQMNEGDRAEQFYQHGLALEPGKPVFYSALGELYYQRKSFEKSFAMFKKAVYLNPKDMRVNLMLGYVLVQLKDLESAAGYFKKSYEISPQHPEALKGIIYYYRATGNQEQRKIFQDQLNRLQK